jgi:uncharacterized DUF497 family protein
MRFECDPKKAKSNFKKHGVPFEEAVNVFYDPLAATFEDPDHLGNEWRFVTIGYSSRNHFLVVSHSDREEVLRIISARIATAPERRRHEG